MVNSTNPYTWERFTSNESILVSLESESTSNKTSNKIAENFNGKIKWDLLDFEYLKSFHPTFDQLILSNQEWDYLEKVKLNFIEDPSKRNLEKTISELRDSQVYLADPILYLFGKALKLQQSKADGWIAQS